MARFDLIDEGWLPLRCKNGGTVIEAGIAEALLDSHEFTDLVVELPTQVPALLRQVLLPIVMDALGAPADRAEWKRRFAAGQFSQAEVGRLRGYLDEHRARFDLFSSSVPFAQVAGLEATNGETKGSGLIVPTEATGNNVPLFASRTEGDVLPLTPAQAARWLLHAHCWDTAAIKPGAKGDEAHVKAGKTTGNPTGPLGQLGLLLPMGRTLYETLLLNMPIGTRAQAGSPQWRAVEPAQANWEIRIPNGLLDLWTWQSRRIRLIPEPGPEGDRVVRIVLAAGDRMRTIPEWEPHTAWAFKKSAEKASAADRRPRRHTSGKAIWRGLEALLALERTDASAGGSVETSTLLVQVGGLEAEGILPDEYPLRLSAYGIVYGNQSAVIEDVYHDDIPLPVAGLRRDADTYGLLLGMVQQAEDLARAVNHLSGDLRRAAGLAPIPWDKAQRPGEQVLHALDPVVRRVLARIQTEQDWGVIQQGLLAWEITAYRAARETAEPLFAAVPESVFTGRQLRRGSGDGASTSTYSLGTAEYNFRAQLNKILPAAADARREQAMSTSTDRADTVDTAT
ncbi:type I-E CRISPR-associated protein Cse1/CasA [Actinomadura formosensis]|uniref:type I-E CRISPR-associated protein Cse1/CasA n=1 Tax=Actinomadura formosensis TaxID=60706 RepID=UPI003D933711